MLVPKNAEVFNVIKSQYLYLGRLCSVTSGLQLLTSETRVQSVWWTNWQWGNFFMVTYLDVLFYQLSSHQNSRLKRPACY